MEANGAPEKIYLQENTTTDCYGEFWPEWFEARAKDSDIEYTRTDAFIEKASSWFNDNCANYIKYELGDSHAVFYIKQMIDDFKKAMKL